MLESLLWQILLRLSYRCSNILFWIEREHFPQWLRIGSITYTWEKHEYSSMPEVRTRVQFSKKVPSNEWVSNELHWCHYCCLNHDANDTAMIDIEVANPLRMLSVNLIVAAINSPLPKQYFSFFPLTLWIKISTWLKSHQDNKTKRISIKYSFFTNICHRIQEGDSREQN